ncbi:MAG TPA: hypothetical protein VEF76_13450 [Patescibacteria group bacterium]|nr:hypothetical protein [Patescibacteria group bacterium]
MSEPDFVPEQPSEQHFQISQKAADTLGRLVDGNGLKAEQVRLARHETLVHQLPGAVIIELVPDFVKGQRKGKVPHGQVMGSEAAVKAAAIGLATESVSDKNVQIELMQLLDKDPARGWGMKPFKHPLKVTRKEFSVVEECLKCSGRAEYICTGCSGTGGVGCTTCGTTGLSQCPACFGSGAVQSGDGGRMGCQRCNASGRIICAACNGAKTVRCAACRGLTKIPCTECDRSGYWTQTFEMTFHAEARFNLDRQQIPRDVQEIVDRLGVRELATEEHAEIFRLAQNPEQKLLVIPFIAFLPIANVDFSIEGKQYPSGVAGLTGLIMGIDPLLDPIIKPGINALFKLSKGPLATEALIDQACKYRVLRQILSGLSHHSKRQVYQSVMKNYPLIISDRFAKASIKYADIALLALSKGPRMKGLVIGSVAAAAIYAGYFLTPAAGFIASKMIALGHAKQVIAADAAVWLLGFIAAWLTVKYMAAGAMQRLLPGEVVDKSDKGLPAAGTQGWQALGITLLAWAACACFALSKPVWVLALLKLVGKAP